MKSIWFVVAISFITSCSAEKNRSNVSGKDSTNIVDSSVQHNKLNCGVKSLDVVSSVVKNSEIKDFLYKCIDENLQKGRIHDREYYPESIVLGHLEEDTIVGNFDGKGVDTLYVDSEECGCDDYLSCEHAQRDERIKYYLVSKSCRLPKIRLLAAQYMPPRIVNEGDLDGDGKSEIGYMYTWGTSQWRTYRILTWHKKQWSYLIDPNEEYMSTSRMFRLSGYEIVEKGRKKGTVLIHFLPEGLNQEVRDTIVRPKYIRIDDI